LLQDLYEIGPAEAAPADYGGLQRIVIYHEISSPRKRGMYEDILHRAVHLYVKGIVTCKVHREPGDRQGPLLRLEQVWYPHVLVIRVAKVTS